MDASSAGWTRAAAQKRTVRDGPQRRKERKLKRVAGFVGETAGETKDCAMTMVVVATIERASGPPSSVRRW